MTIQVKIVGIDEITNSILVKFASAKSAKNIDEYDALAFRITDPSINTKEEFINSIMPTLQQTVDARDIDEETHGSFSKPDLDSWVGHEDTINRISLDTNEADIPTNIAFSINNANAEVLL